MAGLVEDEPAIVLRAIPYGEADRVVTLLCERRGKVAALAKGARRSQKRFAGGLGLFSLGRASFLERQSADLARLEMFEATAMWPGLFADLGKIAHAGYAAELIDALTPAHQPDPPIFALASAFVRTLDAGQADPRLLRVFEMTLLRLLGHRPELQRCVGCGRDADDGAGQRIDPSRGGIGCGRCRAEGPLVDGSVRGALIALQTTELSQLPAASSPAVARGLRVALQSLLSAHLTRALRSVEFIDKLNQATT